MGKHSKPKPKGRGTAIALSVGTVATGMTLGTTPANANSSTDQTMPNWAPIIQCESGNRNVENSTGASTASGYFQFVNGTWRAFGGTEFSPRAIGANKEQQTIVANRAFARNGLRDWNASRSCWGDDESIIRAGVSIQTSNPIPQATTRTPTATSTPTIRRVANTLQCADFSDVNAANTELAKDLSDPHLIDTNNNDIPCEARFGLRGRSAVTGTNVGSSTTPVPLADAPTRSSRSTSSVVALARDLADDGIPYVWGGKTPRAFDCSGFVSYILNQTGQMTGYRNSSALRGWAISISANEARPGDLTFTPGHVGIYLGDGMMADAGSTRTNVTVRAMWDDPNRTFGRPRGV